MKNKAIIYLRKSTEDKNKQIASIKDQRDACMKMIEGTGFEIIECIGGKNNRQALKSLICQNDESHKKTKSQYCGFLETG